MIFMDTPDHYSFTMLAHVFLIASSNAWECLSRNAPKSNLGRDLHIPSKGITTVKVLLPGNIILLRGSQLLLREAADPLPSYIGEQGRSVKGTRLILRPALMPIKTSTQLRGTPPSSHAQRDLHPT